MVLFDSVKMIKLPKNSGWCGCQFIFWDVPKLNENAFQVLAAQKFVERFLYSKDESNVSQTLSELLHELAILNCVCSSADCSSF